MRQQAQFQGYATEKKKISSDEFYSKGGFSNPNLFRTSQGHFEYVESAEYKRWKKLHK